MLARSTAPSLELHPWGLLLSPGTTFIHYLPLPKAPLRLSWLTPSPEQAQLAASQPHSLSQQRKVSNERGLNADKKVQKLLLLKKILFLAPKLRTLPAVLNTNSKACLELIFLSQIELHAFQQLCCETLPRV